MTGRPPDMEVGARPGAPTKVTAAAQAAVPAPTVPRAESSEPGSAPAVPPLAGLLRALGFRRDDRISVNHKRGSHLVPELVSVDRAPQAAARWAHRDVWWGTAPLRPGITRGRGTAHDTAGIRCVFADLDYEPGKARDEATSRAIIDGISGRLKTPPSAIVHSGHGLQPYWTVKRDSTTTFDVGPDPRRDHAAAVLAGFGDLVRAVAAEHDATVDPVFELARILRIPGTTNRKVPAVPVTTSVEYPEGANALTLAEIEAACPAKLAPVAKAPAAPTKGSKVKAPATARVRRTAPAPSTGGMLSTPSDDEPDGLTPYTAGGRRKVLAKLDALAARPWEAGAGWDLAVYQESCNLLELSNGDPAYTREQAHDDLMAHAPRDDSWGEREHEEKWRSAVTKVGDKGRERKITAPVEPVAPDAPVPERPPRETGADRLDGVEVLDRVRAHLARYVSTMRESDLDLLTLWAAHTHFVLETYTTPRLVIDSPVHGSGKTTVLEHLERLCLHSVQMASLSSPALLTRMLDADMRTMLIDEADRSLNPDNDGVAELLAVLNSGYKRGGTRPVLAPTGDGGWAAKEMPTYCPVAMAGNNPLLPEDTKSRTIRVLLLPDLEGRVEESDWEMIEDATKALGDLLVTWADQVRDDVRAHRPPLPDGIVGRGRERWSPLKRVAHAAGGRWPAVVDELALHDKAQHDLDREDGMVRDRPAVAVLKHLHDLWPVGEPFMPTATLVSCLVTEHPDEWGLASPFGKALTAQRFGRMLATSYSLNSARLDRTGPRGYVHASLVPLWKRMGIVQSPAPGTGGGEPVSMDREPSSSTFTPSAPVSLGGLSGTGASGATGSTGAEDDEVPPFPHVSTPGSPPCRVCGQALLLVRPGRDVCERCRLAQVAVTA